MTRKTSLDKLGDLGVPACLTGQIDKTAVEKGVLGHFTVNASVLLKSLASWVAFALPAPHVSEGPGVRMEAVTTPAAASSKGRTSSRSPLRLML